MHGFRESRLIDGRKALQIGPDLLKKIVQGLLIYQPSIYEGPHIQGVALASQAIRE